jgi:hypothetical protein
LVKLIQKEYQKRGMEMAKNKIVRNLLEKATQEFLEMSRESNAAVMLTARTERLAHFEKNYKKK